MNKIWGMSKLIWLIISLCLLVCSFGFLVGAMDYDYWFYQKLKFEYGGVKYTTEIKGSLLHPKDKSNTFKHYYNDCSNDSIGGKGYCHELDSFYSAGVAYVFFDSIASILVVVISGIIVVNLLKVEFLKRFLTLGVSAILLILVAALHLLSFIIWSGTVKLVYDDCTFDIPMSDRHSVCGKGGSALAIWTIFFLAFFAVFYFMLVRKIKIEEENEKNSGNYQQLR